MLLAVHCYIVTGPFGANPTQPNVTGKLSQLLCIRDNSSASNVLHQTSNTALGFCDPECEPVKAKRAIEALHAFVSEIVGRVDDRRLAQDLIAPNKFGNNPLHLLFAQLPVAQSAVSPSVFNKKVAGVAQMLVAVCKLAHNARWESTVLNQANEFGHRPTDVLFNACKQQRDPSQFRQQNRFDKLLRAVFLDDAGRICREQALHQRLSAGCAAAAAAGSSGSGRGSGGGAEVAARAAAGASNGTAASGITSGVAEGTCPDVVDITHGLEAAVVPR